MDMNVFATRLKETRESLNISADELAEAIGVSRATIFRYEKAEFKSVKQSTLDAISEYLNVNPDYLIGRSDEKYNFNNIENISDKEKKEIDDILNMTTDLLKQEGLMFDGTPADEESVQSIIDAMRVGLEIAKRRNKEKYTPNKHKR